MQLQQSGEFFATDGIMVIIGGSGGKEAQIAALVAIPDQVSTVFLTISYALSPASESHMGTQLSQHVENAHICSVY